LFLISPAPPGFFFVRHPGDTIANTASTATLFAVQTKPVFARATLSQRTGKMALAEPLIGIASTSI
jgi:hypothetical protein